LWAIAGAYVPKRTGQRWLIASVPVFLLIVIIVLHRLSPEQATVLAQSVVHSLHAPGFAVVALTILLYLHWQNRTPLNYLLAAAAAMGVGVLSEIAQIPGPRDAQFKDLLIDGIGIFGALGAAALWDRDVRLLLPRNQRAVLAAASLAALAFSFWPTISQSYSMLQRYRAMPVLLSFENAWERNIFREHSDGLPMIVDAPDGWPGPGD
jgi:hypothetical protein